MGTHTINSDAMVSGVMDSLRSLVRALRTSAHAVERGTGITGAQLFVLRRLADSPAASMNELAERTSTHQSSVSVVVTRLAERGLVERVPAAVDARRVGIRITPAGEALLGGAPGTAQERLVETLRRMPAARLDLLSAGLHDLLTSAGLDTPTAGFFFEDDA
jgi:MarR family transcriptional regulator, lower aerobic nicotinate degradation pathway regulator